MADKPENDFYIQLAACFQRCMQTSDGKQVFQTLKDLCFVESSSISGKDGLAINEDMTAIDPLFVIRNEGRREVFLYFSALLNMDLSKALEDGIITMETDNDSIDKP